MKGGAASASPRETTSVRLSAPPRKPAHMRMHSTSLRESWMNLLPACSGGASPAHASIEWCQLSRVEAKRSRACFSMSPCGELRRIVTLQLRSCCNAQERNVCDMRCASHSSPSLREASPTWAQIVALLGGQSGNGPGHGLFRKVQCLCQRASTTRLDHFPTATKYASGNGSAITGRSAASPSIPHACRSAPAETVASSALPRSSRTPISQFLYYVLKSSRRIVI